MLLTNQQVFCTGVDLGLIISVCNADGFELARNGFGPNVDERQADLRTTPARGGCCYVEALTEDGRVFLDLTES